MGDDWTVSPSGRYRYVVMEDEKQREWLCFLVIEPDADQEHQIQPIASYCFHRRYMKQVRWLDGMDVLLFDSSDAGHLFFRSVDGTWTMAQGDAFETYMQHMQNLADTEKTASAL